MRARFGEFVLDTAARELRRGGTPVHLTPKAIALLECLVERPHRAVPKGEILEQVWPATFVSDASLTSVVKELRHALGDSARTPRFVRGVRGFGYAFCADTELDPEPRADGRAGDGRPPCELRVSSGQREVALGEGDSLLGRTHEAAFWVEHASVSRRHARIRVVDGKATIEDCGSKNGTFLRGQRIDGPRELRDGDEVRLGTAPALLFRAYPADGSTASVDSRER